MFVPGHVVSPSLPRPTSHAFFHVFLSCPFICRFCVRGLTLRPKTRGTTCRLTTPPSSFLLSSLFLYHHGRFVILHFPRDPNLQFLLLTSPRLVHYPLAKLFGAMKSLSFNKRCLKTISSSEFHESSKPQEKDF